MRQIPLISQKEQSFIEKAAYLGNLFSQHGHNTVCETLWYKIKQISLRKEIYSRRFAQGNFSAPFEFKNSRICKHQYDALH